jgi:phage/plasmid-associated DNA primase
MLKQGIFIADVDNFKHKKWTILKDDNDNDIPGTGTNNLLLYECYDNIDTLVTKLETESKFYNSRIGLDPNRKIKFIFDFDKFDETGVNTIYDYLKSIIDYFKKIFNIHITIDDFAITKNDDYKDYPLASYHVVLTKIVDTPANQKKIIYEGLQAFNKLLFKKTTLDSTIYSSHWFRLPNQHKGKTKNIYDPGVHKIIKGNMIDFIPEYYDENKVIILDLNNLTYKTLLSKKTVKKEKILQLPTEKSDFDIIFSDDQTLELIPKLLDLLGPEYYDGDPYELWIDILMICKNVLGEKGREIARTFSKKSNKYTTDQDFDFKWNSFKNNGNKKIGSLFYYCYQNPANAKLLKEFKTHGKHIYDVTDNWLAKELKLMISKNFVTQKIISKKTEIIKVLYFSDEKGWNYDTDTNSALNNYISDEFKHQIFRKYESENVFWHDKWDAIKKYCGSNAKKAAVIKEFKNICAMDSSSIEFDKQPYLLKFKNGVLDLLEGTFREHRYTDYILQNTKINWREPTDEELETMNKFFDSIFKDAKMKHLLFKMLASGLTGVFVEKFIIWWGDGGNGKGTINDFMGYLLGDYYYECNSTYLTLERDVGNDEILASFKGKRFIKASEPSKAYMASKIKSLTGETRITATAKYESGDSTNSTFDAEFTLICETNKRELRFKKEADETSNQKDINALKRRQISMPWIIQFTDDSEDLDNPNYVMGNPLYKTKEFKESHIYAFARIIIPYVKIFLDERFNDLPDQVRELTNEGLIENSIFYDFWITHYELDDYSKSLFGLREMWNEFIDFKTGPNISKTKRAYPETEFKKFVRMAVKKNNIVIKNNVSYLSGYKNINNCNL